MRLFKNTIFVLGIAAIALSSCNREEDINSASQYVGKWQVGSVFIHQYSGEEFAYDTTIGIATQLENIEFERSGKYIDSNYILLPKWYALFNTILDQGTWEVGANFNSLVLDRNVTDAILTVENVSIDELSLKYWDTANRQIHDTSNFSYCVQYGEYNGFNDASKAFNVTGYDNGYIYGYEFGFADGYTANYATLDYDLFNAYYIGFYNEYNSNYFGGGDAQFDSGHTDGYNDGYAAGAAFGASNDNGSLKSYEIEYLMNR